MEFERKHWIRPYVPTGLSKEWPKFDRHKAIHESELPKLKEMSESGKSRAQLAKIFGCSETTIKTTLRAMQ